MIVCWSCSSTTDGNVACHQQREGCPPDSPDEVWEALARENGFYDGPSENFFHLAGSACDVEPAFAVPEDLVALAALSTIVVRGKVEGIVPAARLDATTDFADYVVRFQIGITAQVRGVIDGPILVTDYCAVGGKIASLRKSLPEDEFLFFLDGPWPLNPDADVAPEEVLAYGLTWYHVSVIGRSNAGLRFEYATDGRFDSLLSGYNTLEDIETHLAAVGLPPTN